MYNIAREQNHSLLLDDPEFFYQSNISRSKFWAPIDDGSPGYILWTDLPPSIYPNTTIGAIVVFGSAGWDNHFEDPGARHTAACLVSATWGVSTLNTTANTNTSTLLVVQSTRFENSWNDVQAWPQGRVAITHAWADLLAPALIGGSGTVAEALIPAFEVPTNIGGQPWLDSSVPQFEDPAPGKPVVPLTSRRSYNYEIMMAGLFASGMARAGIVQYGQNNYAFQNPLLLPSNESGTDGVDYYTIKMQVEVVGLAYNLEGVPIKLAIAVLLIYCIFAVVHVCYAAISGVSSNSWDSILELTALAINSSRTQLLNRTSAGVETMDTVRQPVKICAVNDDHLEIVFSQDGLEGKGFRKVVKNRAY
jgi:hypothetical protein